jgi:hypothetical protein
MDAVDDDMQHVPQPNFTPQTNVAHLKVQIDTLSTKDNDALIEAMGSSVKLPRAWRARLEQGFVWRGSECCTRRSQLKLW